MPRKKKLTAGATPALEIPKELLERRVPGPMTAEGLESMFKQFKRLLLFLPSRA